MLGERRRVGRALGAGAQDQSCYGHRSLVAICLSGATRGGNARFATEPRVHGMRWLAGFVGGLQRGCGPSELRNSAGGAGQMGLGMFGHIGAAWFGVLSAVLMRCGGPSG